MSNLTQAHRDSYLEYFRGWVKQDTHTALCTAPVHFKSLFPDQLLVKAGDEISRSEERRSPCSSHRKPGLFLPYASSTSKPAHQLDQKSNVPAGSRSGTGNTERKDGARNWLRVPSRVNDNYCVQSVARQKDSVYVSGKLESLNPSAVIAGRKDLTSKSETVNSHVNSCVVNFHSVTGLPKKKGVIPFYCQNYTEIKYVKNGSCVDHLSSINLVTNVPTVALDQPVVARLHHFWAALGASPKVVTVLREGYTLPFGSDPT